MKNNFIKKDLIINRLSKKNGFVNDKQTIIINNSLIKKLRAFSELKNVNNKPVMLRGLNRFIVKYKNNYNSLSDKLFNKKIILIDAVKYKIPVNLYKKN